jgi:hypothetical protein
MTVRKLKRYFKRHRAKIERALLDGTYTPLPVRQKEIGKPGGVVFVSSVFPQHLTEQSSRLWPKS